MLPNFDPALDLYATRELLAGGRIFKRGDKFDKSLVTTRKLFLMFQYKHLCYDWMIDPDTIDKKGRGKKKVTSKNSESITETATLKSIKIKIDGGATVDVTDINDDKDLKELLNLPQTNTAE